MKNLPNYARPKITDFRALLKDLAAQRGDRNSDYVGLRALQDIHSYHGKQGIDEFLEWANHPTIGHLAWNNSVKPLPIHLRDIFGDIARSENQRNIEPPQNPIHSNESNSERYYHLRTRRQFLGSVLPIAAAGALMGAAMPQFDITGASNKGATADSEAKAASIAGGATVGALLALYAAKVKALQGTNKKRLLFELRQLPVQTTFAQDKVWDVDSVACAALALLEAYMNAEKSARK